MLFIMSSLLGWRQLADSQNHYFQISQFSRLECSLVSSMRVFNREQKPDKGGLETKVLIQETRGKGKNLCETELFRIIWRREFFIRSKRLEMMTMLCVYVSGVQTSHFRGCLIGSDMCQPISHFDVLLSVMTMIMKRILMNKKLIE